MRGNFQTSAGEEEEAVSAGESVPRYLLAEIVSEQCVFRGLRKNNGMGPFIGRSRI